MKKINKEKVITNVLAYALTVTIIIAIIAVIPQFRYMLDFGFIVKCSLYVLAGVICSSLLKKDKKRPRINFWGFLYFPLYFYSFLSY